MHEDTQAQKHACRDMFENTHKRGDTDTHTGPREAKEQPMHKHMTVKLRFLATLTHCTTYSHGHSMAATKGTADLFICKSAPIYFCHQLGYHGKVGGRRRRGCHDYRNPEEPTITTRSLSKPEGADHELRRAVIDPETDDAPSQSTPLEPTARACMEQEPIPTINRGSGPHANHRPRQIPNHHTYGAQWS